MEMPKGGRPKSIIDWKKVEKLLEGGCSGAQIAGYLGIDKQTIYERCVKDNGIPFAQYSQQFYSKGESELAIHQYNKAIGNTDKGDNTLLIWLGKTRLKQREADSLDAVIDDNTRNQLNSLLSTLSGLQSKASHDRTSDSKIESTEENS